MAEKRDNTEVLGGGYVFNNVFYPKKNLASGTIRIVLTTECNFNCRYCFAEGEDKNFRILEPEFIGKVLKVAKEFGINKVKLTGGEPLIYPHLEEVLQIINDLKMDYIDITTNISLLDNDMIDRLNRYNVSAITLSLHTMDKDKFRKISGGYNDFDNILRNIQNAIDRFNGKVRINSVVFDELFNIDDYMKIFDFCRANNLGLRFVEPTRVDGFEMTNEKTKYKELVDYIESRCDSKVGSLCESVKYYFFDNWYLTTMNSLCDNLLCDSCKEYMYVRLTSDKKLKPCLSRRDTEIPVDDSNEENIRKSFVLAIDNMGKGLNLVK